MFQKLGIFQMAHAMATHAGRLQVVTAQNMANADTPGFKAKSLTPFKDTLRTSGTGTAQRATRSGHLNGAAPDGPVAIPARIILDEAAQSDPNGNSVAIEDEILRSVEAKRQHDRALAIYRSSMNILRTSIGRT
ncbi:MAG: FlgB family protein [Planktotalea sp.]|uniref:FlgB family protein n=1 Tax=Planktotalea sp. TaxID=2029877 RepID=UPI003C712AAF